MNAPPSSSLFASARVILGREVPERSKLAKLLVENGAFCITGSSAAPELQFPPTVVFGDVYFLLDSFTGVCLNQLYFELL